MSDDMSSMAYGNLPLQVSIAELRSRLADCGLTPTWGDTHHVGLKDCSLFVFRDHHSGGYLISADADTVEQLMADVRHVSDALSKGRLPHLIEVHESEDRLVRKFAYRPQPRD